MDHLGNKFKSIKEMCKHYNISYSRYLFRINEGYTLEMALTEPLKDYKVVDHLGNSYDSIRKMCEHYNISTGTYWKRMNGGYSLERALTEPLNEKYKPKVVVDHLGKQYESIAQMCREYEIPVSAYFGRINAGYTIERALTKPISFKSRI